MRAGKRLLAPLALAASLLALAAPAAHAAGPTSGITELAMRVRGALPFLGSVPDLVPQAVAQAGPDGPTVSVARLDDPARIERDLRAAMQDPPSATRLTIPDGMARLGPYTLGSTEVQRGHVVVLRGNAEVHGRLEGNLVTLDGDITIHPGATVVGDLLAIGGRVREAGGTVLGTIQSLEAIDPNAAATSAPGLPGLVASRGAGAVGVFLTFLVLGFGLVTFGRPNLEIVSDTVTQSFGRSFLVGVLGQILLLPTFGMLVVGLVLTVAGLLLVPFAVVVYALLAIVAVLGGLLAVAHAMGERITRRRMAHGHAMSPNSYRYLATGLAGLAVIWLGWVAFGWVPVAGTVIFGAAVLATWFVTTVGFGAALLSRGGIREDFAGRFLPPAMMTDEYLWATPQFGVPAVTRPPKEPS